MREREAEVGSSLVFAERLKIGATAYVLVGQGPPLIFIHGVGLSADAWWPQIEAFSASHLVYAVDMLGHGGSDQPPEGATLEDYVTQIAAFMTDLRIDAATLVGHSMGAMVALGLALRKPNLVYRLVVLNGVYDRDARSRADVMDRAAAINQYTDIVSGPMQRWFGGMAAESPAALKIGALLSRADRGGYAAAYTVFASGDADSVGRLPDLKMPCLFLTGGDDPNSTPAMAKTMAAAVMHGDAIILDGQRHMMHVAVPDDVNALIREFLQRRSAIGDTRALRQAFGTFMTGVTVVTTQQDDGSFRGFTANSFSSVSLDPPLLLVCLAKAASSYPTFSEARRFAVNILAEGQRDVSGVFASKQPDKFAVVPWRLSAGGNALLAETTAWFDCTTHEVVEAGDHVILIGRVEEFSTSDRGPLGYVRGGYVTLGLEQAAVNAATGAGRTVVGAILECQGQLVLIADAKTGALHLPEVGRTGPSGTVSTLQGNLAKSGIVASLGFLFAVYENVELKLQSIYYRGEAIAAGSGQLFDFDNLPWARFADPAASIMVQRYVEERLEGRFKIYSGDHERGVFKTLEPD
jgi:(E)-2-((N-methylformamido)methylene)succinate hydrolase